MRLCSTVCTENPTQREGRTGQLCYQLHFDLSCLLYVLSKPIVRRLRALAVCSEGDAIPGKYPSGGCTECENVSKEFQRQLIKW